MLEETAESASELRVEADPPWSNSTSVPDSVQAKAAEVGVCIALSDWNNLSPLQRFALIKLSRANHENRNFLPALKEFQVI